MTDESPDELFTRVYDELRRLAAKYRQKGSGEIDRSSLVHEAFIKMQGTEAINDAEHFYAIAATAIRQVLVDRARREHAQKRGGGWKRVTLAGLGEEEADSLVDVINLDDALTALAEQDERRARIVELRFFGGLTNAQIAERLEVSKSTVEKEWRAARDWLAPRL